MWENFKATMNGNMSRKPLGRNFELFLVWKENQEYLNYRQPQVTYKKRVYEYTPEVNTRNTTWRTKVILLNVLFTSIWNVSGDPLDFIKIEIRMVPPTL